MSYVDRKKVYLTLEGVKCFTYCSRSGKLSKGAYPDQDDDTVKGIIDLRRKTAFDAIQKGFASLQAVIKDEVDDDDDASMHSHESDC